MEFAEWEPTYELILADFGYDRVGDESVRNRMAELAEPFDLDRLDCSGLTVAVAGSGPSLDVELDRASDADRVFAASTATDRLVDAGVAVDAMITDLDKNPETGLDRTERGAPVVAHAHGDNGDLVEEWMPRYDAEHVLATTQAEPVGPVRNFGGFTDGDRAAFLADALDAAELRFIGWDFDDPGVSDEKARKLRWAERLLHLLERRRGEEFAVLDGRRAHIESL
ncbi:DUF115 domain-containing protein [Halorarum halophilum]|uniref:6-hydroxymethyl-7,8-dihydropterin pyrophosphokinase n=1 Tax=Halorarum halophilum TaxID=2743090 RepID=A0A7D5KU44_9EURY|nr:6-hydroxymethylpterin diphosphokinase MptE-like protein [Halobaculum halophilum]QLG26940.1 DUF115 domain-containing protein [Halobaculum halophilum]